MSFPTRDSRSNFGETMENIHPVTNPKQDIDAAIINRVWWDVAGQNRVTPLVVIRATVASGAVTVAYQGLAWDPNGSLANITITYNAAGYYSFAFSSQYPDDTGTNRNLALDSGIAVPCETSADSGTHTGANNVAVLTDAAQGWTVNELVGKYIYNLTDGSWGLITANTANTVTIGALLAGGTDNDWDTGDAYIIHYGSQSTVAGRAFEDFDPTSPRACGPEFGGGRSSTNYPNFSSDMTCYVRYNIGVGTPATEQQRRIAVAETLLNEQLPTWADYAIYTTVGGFILGVDPNQSLLNYGAF